jgi:hypothetical protein
MQPKIVNIEYPKQVVKSEEADNIKSHDELNALRSAENPSLLHQKPSEVKKKEDKK